MEADRGFSTENILTADLNLSGFELGPSFQRDLIEKIEAMPEVHVAGIVSLLPLAGESDVDAVLPRERRRTLRRFSNALMPTFVAQVRGTSGLWVSPSPRGVCSRLVTEIDASRSSVGNWLSACGRSRRSMASSIGKLRFPTQFISQEYPRRPFELIA